MKTLNHWLAQKTETDIIAKTKEQDYIGAFDILVSLVYALREKGLEDEAYNLLDRHSELVATIQHGGK